MKKNIFLTGLVCAGILLGCEPPDKRVLQGLKAYREKDYNTASIVLEHDANAGHEGAALALGTLNALGKGIAKNIPQAKTLFDKVTSDRLNDRYAAIAGEAAATEMAETLALYRKGELKEDPPPAPVESYSYTPMPTPVYVPPVVESAPAAPKIPKPGEGQYVPPWSPPPAVDGQ